jgi:hypothetical protein
MMFMRGNPDFVSVIGAASSMEISMVNSGRSGKSTAVRKTENGQVGVNSEASEVNRPDTSPAAPSLHDCYYCYAAQYDVPLETPIAVSLAVCNSHRAEHYFQMTRNLNEALSMFLAAKELEKIASEAYMTSLDPLNNCERCGEPWPEDGDEGSRHWTNCLCYDGRVHITCPNCEPVIEEDDPDEDRREMMGL